MTDYLGQAYPTLAQNLQKCAFASLPTPVSCGEVETASGRHRISIKHDDQTSPIYGGNKVRKLEYILQRARDRGARRIATFGAVGSNHALATAIFAKRLGFECTCFLAHQSPTPNVPKTLNMHLKLGTEIVRYGGSARRLDLFRRYLQNRGTWVIPLGGSCWLGAVGFVNAGLELAAQIDTGEIDAPDRIFIANGTMGSAAGLAIGLALSKLPTEVHAVRVADNQYTHINVMRRLILKTVTLLSRYEPTLPADLMQRINIVWRDEFFAGGYAVADGATNHAIDVARDQLGLILETTYTGKAMAALLNELDKSKSSGVNLFWNTYNSRPLPVSGRKPLSMSRLPESFHRYYS